MKLLFVVQRYGVDVFGGAEALCRDFATRLVARGHEVDVLTSCAISYVDWANTYPAGTASMDGVSVHRLPVDRPRDHDLFNPLNVRVNAGMRPTPLYLQRAWMDLQGPHLPDLPKWLAERARDFDVVVFFTYLYWSTWAGLPVASAVAPTVLHPLAHDEPPLYLALFDLEFRQPDAFGFLTEEEALLVAGRFGVRRPSTTTGVGIDLAPETGDVAGFREANGLGDDPYLLYVGRLDPHKGSEELFTYFTTYKARHPGPLRLAVVGEPVRPLPPHPDVVTTGWVDEATKHAAIEGAALLVQPSYFESFSMILAEAWVHRKAALVQGRCDVLAGQARRSGGALPYAGYAEFEAGIDLLQERPSLADAMGAAGRRFVEANYTWDHVLDKYERFLSSVAR
jgi:glycosyltransferase involved in cell wall biosynthesis